MSACCNSLQMLAFERSFFLYKLFLLIKKKMEVIESMILDRKECLRIVCVPT